MMIYCETTRRLQGNSQSWQAVISCRTALSQDLALLWKNCAGWIEDWKSNAHLKPEVWNVWIVVLLISTNYKSQIICQAFTQLTWEEITEIRQVPVESNYWMLLSVTDRFSVSLDTSTTLAEATHAQSTSPLLLRSLWGKLNGRELRIVPEVRGSVSTPAGKVFQSKVNLRDTFEILWVYANLAMNSTCLSMFHSKKYLYTWIQLRRILGSKMMHA